MNIYTIHTDGGARGNPGPAAIGVVVEKEGKEVRSISKAIGKATNNVAEYTAVVEALKYLHSIHIDKKETTIHFILDSLLVVNQLNGIFKIKDANLRTLIIHIKSLEQEVGGVITYVAVPREKNTRADALVNQALDT